MIQPTFIAELVLGYLSDEGLAKTSEAFQKECLLLQESNTSSSPNLDQLSLKAILEDYLSVKVNRKNATGNPELSSLWKKFDGLVGQLKYATIGKSNLVKTTQAGRTKRLNQGTFNAGVGAGTKNSSPHKVARNPPHAWQPVRRSPKKNPQPLHPLRTVSAEKGNFRQVINPALADMNNVLLSIPPFPNAANQQSPAIMAQPVIGQLPCLIGQFPLVNSSALIQANGVVPTYGTPLTGCVPYLNAPAPVVGSSGSGCITGVVPSASSQSLNGQPAHVRGQFPAVTLPSIKSFQQGSALPTSNVTQPATLQDSQTGGPSSAPASNPGLSSPAMVSLASGSCASSPINVEDVSPFGSPSPIRTTDKEKVQTDNYMCEVMDEGDARSTKVSVAEAKPCNGVGEMLSVGQGASQTQQFMGSPRRKCNQPRKRGHGVISPEKQAASNALNLPNPEMHPDDGSSSLVENAVPYFLDTLLNEPLLQEKLAENINKLVASSKQDSSNPEESAAQGPSDSSQVPLAPVNDLLSLMEADPAFGSLFSLFGEDALEVVPSFDEPSGMASGQPRDSNAANEMAPFVSTTTAGSKATTVVTDTLLVASPSAKVLGICSQADQLATNSLQPDEPLQLPSKAARTTTQGNPSRVSHAQVSTDLPHLPHVRTLDFSSRDQGEPKKKRGRKKGSRNMKTLLLEKKKLDSKTEQELRVGTAPGVSQQAILTINPNSSCNFPKTATCVLQALAKNHLNSPSSALVYDGLGERMGASSPALSNQSDRSTTNIAENSIPNARTPQSSSTLTVLDKSVPIRSAGLALTTQSSQRLGTLLPTCNGNDTVPGHLTTSVTSSQSLQGSRTSSLGASGDETSQGGFGSDSRSMRSASLSATHSAASQRPRSGVIETLKTVLSGRTKRPEPVSSSVSSSVSFNTISSHADNRNRPELSSDSRNGTSRVNLEDDRSRESVSHHVFPGNVDALSSGNLDVETVGDATRNSLSDTRNETSRVVLSDGEKHVEPVSHAAFPRKLDPRSSGSVSSSSGHVEAARAATRNPGSDGSDRSRVLSEDDRRRKSLSHDVFPRNVEARISEKLDVSSSSQSVGDSSRDAALRNIVDNFSPGVKSVESVGVENEAMVCDQLHREKKRRSSPRARDKTKKSRGSNGIKKSKNKREKVVSFPAGLDVDKFLSALHYEDK